MDLVRFHNRRNGGTEGGDCNALRIGGGRGMTGGDLEAVLHVAVSEDEGEKLISEGEREDNIKDIDRQ